MGLTQIECRTLDAIKDYIAREGQGISPTYDEIAQRIGVRSKSTINRALTGLAAKGYIRKLYARARAIELLCYSYPAPGLVSRDADGIVTEVARLKFIPVRNLRPLNLKQIARAA